MGLYALGVVLTEVLKISLPFEHRAEADPAWWEDQSTYEAIDFKASIRVLVTG